MEPEAENSGLAMATTSHSGTIQTNDPAVARAPRHTAEHASAPKNESATNTGCSAAMDMTMAHARKTNATAGWYVAKGLRFMYAEMRDGG